MKLIIFTDGASRGNPGPAAYGFTIVDENGKLIYKEGCYIGETTNNVAEYTAVFRALDYVKKKYEHKNPKVELFADSKLICEQLSGNYKVKAKHLKPLIEKIKILSLELGGVIYTHIPRAKNFAADEIANIALDSR